MRLRTALATRRFAPSEGEPTRGEGTAFVQCRRVHSEMESHTAGGTCDVITTTGKTP